MELLNRSERIRLTRQNMRDHGALIADEYASGKRLKQLASEWHTSMATIAKTVREHGGEIRDQGNAGKGDRMKQSRINAREHGAEIVADYESGQRLQDLAERWNMGLTTISAIVRANGGTIRKRGMGSGNYTMERNHRFRNGRYVNGDGYVHVLLPLDSPWLPMARTKRYVPEHRLVMAQSLGRLLTRYETVHHIDNDPGNNDLSNLQLRNGRHGKGAHFVCGDCGSRNVVAARI